MGRRSTRIRASIAVTATFIGEDAPIVCRTRDVSPDGAFLEVHAAEPELGTPCTLQLFDDALGMAIEVDGEVVRFMPAGPGRAAGVGVHLIDPGDGWLALVARLGATASEEAARQSRRLRILVVGDGARQRGAMALYVKSGWDVRFASDLPGTREALAGFRIDAIVAEVELDDARWPRIFEEVRRQQPQARRVIRAGLKGHEPPPLGAPSDLVHRIVDLDAGIDAFVAALSD